MDYKKLIERLNAYSAEHQCHGGITAEAADAIETLLAERNAAVADIQKNCNTCRWWHDGGCCAPLELYGGCDFSVRQAWEWRGPQNSSTVLV